jgi:polyhydroxybutyrate depolymerase
MTAGIYPDSRWCARLGSLTCVVLLVSLVSCGQSAVKPRTGSSPSPNTVEHGSLTVAGLKRTYRLLAPPPTNPARASPVAFVLTGCPGTGDEMADLSKADTLATTGGFVVVYPDPIPDASGDPSNLEGCWNAGTCCGDAQAKGVDDVKFIGALLDRLMADSTIDKARVFVAGLSSGGMMAYRLACELSDRIAAIASVSGTQVIQTCRPARPISILEMHGTSDDRLPYEGDQYFGSPTSTIQRWVTLNGCSATPTKTTDGITNTSTWSQCHEGSIVRFDTIVGGHHSWFGSDMDPVPGEPSANSAVGEFFKNATPRP